MRTGIVIAGVLLLAGCGARQDLKPTAGNTLPPKPAFATTVPTATDLMTPPSQAMPTRNDELLTRSQERTNDRFSQPPRP